MIRQTEFTIECGSRDVRFMRATGTELAPGECGVVVSAADRRPSFVMLPGQAYDLEIYRTSDMLRIVLNAATTGSYDGVLPKLVLLQHDDFDECYEAAFGFQSDTDPGG